MRSASRWLSVKFIRWNLLSLLSVYSFLFFCFVESRMAAAGLLDAPSRKKQYFTNSEMQRFETGGGVQDDHIPFHRRGLLSLR